MWLDLLVWFVGYVSTFALIVSLLILLFDYLGWCFTGCVVVYWFEFAGCSFTSSVVEVLVYVDFCSLSLLLLIVGFTFAFTVWLFPCGWLCLLVCCFGDLVWSGCLWGWFCVDNFGSFLCVVVCFLVLGYCWYVIWFFIVAYWFVVCGFWLICH